MLQTATGVMTLVLVAICAMYAVQARQREQEARRIPFIVDISNDLSVAAQNFRLERGAVTRALIIAATISDADRSEIAMRRAESDESLEMALKKLGNVSRAEVSPLLDELRSSRNLFIALRRETDAAIAPPGPRSTTGLSAQSTPCPVSSTMKSATRTRS